MRKSEKERAFKSHRIAGLTRLVLAIGILNVSLLSQNNTKTIKPILVLRDANAPSFSFDGKRIAVGTEIGHDEIYDVDSGKRIASFNTPMSQAAILSSNGKQIRVFAGDLNILYDVDSGKRLSEGRSVVTRDQQLIGTLGVTFSSGLLSKNITSDLNIAASFNSPQDDNKSNQNHPAVLIGRLDNNSLVREILVDDGFVRGDVWEEIVLTPNGKYLAAERRNLAGLSRDKTVIWDTQTGKILFTASFNSYGFSLSEDGGRIATRRPPDDFAIEIWDVKTGKKVSTISLIANGKKIKVNSLALSPDGKFLVTTRDANFYFWNADTGKFIISQRQDDITNDHSKVALFSGDGRRIAVCTYGETITIWSVEGILKRVRQ